MRNKEIAFTKGNWLSQTEKILPKIKRPVYIGERASYQIKGKHKFTNQRPNFSLGIQVSSSSLEFLIDKSFMP